MRRSALAILFMLVPIVAGCSNEAATVAAPVWRPDPFAGEVAYLERLERFDFPRQPVDTDERLVQAGHEMCRGLANGIGYQGVRPALEGLGFTRQQATMIIPAANYELCPQEQLFDS